MEILLGQKCFSTESGPLTPRVQLYRNSSQNHFTFYSACSSLTNRCIAQQLFYGKHQPRHFYHEKDASRAIKTTPQNERALISNKHAVQQNSVCPE